MKLYSFSKKSWHVMFFKWLFNEDPTHSYKTMCPYFWTYVLIFLFIVPILIVKLFGRAGTRFLSWSKDYSYNKKMKAIEKLILDCANPHLTPKEAHRIMCSKCWKEYKYEVDYNDRNRLSGLYWKEQDRLDKIENEAARKRYAAQQARKREFDKVNQKVGEIKEYKAFTYISYLVVGAMGAFLLYGFWLLISMIPIHLVDWPKVGEYSLYILAILAGLTTLGFVGYGLFKYMLKPFFNWVSCISLPRCGLCENMSAFFRWCGSWMKYGLYIVMPIWWLILGIGKVCVIIGHMIYSTYKKSCPIIEWKE